jgi:CheY-like chemotaxis protein
MVQIQYRFQQVLIIDDDFSSLFLARLTLEDMGIAEKVVPLQNAQAGLDLLRQTCYGEQATGSCPDLILLDINMPGMDGFDFLDCLRAVGQESLINRVVVALTSSSAAKDRQLMNSYGVRHFLVKPLTEDKVRELLD